MHISIDFFQRTVTIMIVVLILAFTTSGMAESCNHIWIDTNTGYTQSLYAINSNGHVFRYRKLVVCSLCGASDYVDVNNPIAYPDITYPHIFSIRYTDLGHVENTYFHRFVYKCSASFCSFTTIQTVPCDLDCIHYVNKKPVVTE